MSLDLQTLADLGEFLGGLGVIVSLVHLAIQIRSNTSSVRSENYANSLERMASMQEYLARDRCDLRVAARDAVFGVYCRRWGVPLIATGLANRLVEPGHALSGALDLACSLADFLQRCLRADRLSALTQWGEPEAAALREETSRGLDLIRSGETQAGATRFAKGAGRHGSF